MGFCLMFRDLCLMILLASVAGTQAADFDITKYGAKAGGPDNAKALTDAWKAACASPTPSAVVIPKGTFGAGHVVFDGPCKAAIEFRLTGILQAPKDLKVFKGIDGWVVINHVDRLTITGGGTFDGQGQEAWASNNCGKNPDCASLAINIRLNFVTNSVVRGVTSLNSKNFHINVLGCKNLTFDHVTVTAPATSINTDGIHVGRSSGINITDSNIGTGDDCVSIGEGSEQVSVTRVNCGPGHGISVGSLGKYKDESPVVGIFVKHCTLTKTENGVRIKTWPASPEGVAKDMHFENITMNDVGNPILIDQGYCPYNQCTAKVPSKVKISDVSFKGIRGTSTTPAAVKLICSSAVPCTNVQIGDVNLKYTGKEGPCKSQCENVKPILSGKQEPPTCV